MKKIIFILLGITFLFSNGGEVSAQSKTKAKSKKVTKKKTPALLEPTKKPSGSATTPCVEMRVTTVPYGVAAGSDENPPPSTKEPCSNNGATTALKILFKPKANYTDAARDNQVQGNVTLRVTFLANGTIGNISPVSGLPNGLTEQALAAAQNIRFEPARKNGDPHSVVKSLIYNFTLY